MKIAFLIERFDPQRGGMETSAKEFLTEIVALGVEAHVVTQTGSDFARAPVHLLGRGGFGRSGRYRHFVETADAFLAREKWDVIHAVTPCRRCDLYQPRAGVAQVALERTIAVRKSAVAKALRRWGAALNAKERLLTRLEGQLLTGPRPPMVAALSSYMRRQLEQVYAVPPERMRDVFNGVTVELPEAAERAVTRERLRQDLGLSATDCVAIFAGHNFRRKGLLRLLEALARPEAEGWKLLVAGKDAPGAYQRFAASAGIEQRVQFLGPRKDVRQLYLAADVCALPTYYDPCSRTILEALSLGVPCITTKFDGSADCIRNGEHGFGVSSPEAIEELANALRQMKPGAVRQQMSQSALALRPQLAMRRHAEQVLRVYEEIVGQR